MKTKAIAYLRCSTSEQAESGLGLDAQRARIIAYAALYDVEIVRFEVDAGLSGSSLKRPALQSALASLRDGTANALLVVKLDRLTRSVGDLSNLLSDYFADGQFALLSVSDQFDTRSAGGRLVMNIMASVGQWEKEVIQERTKAALSVKKQRGERVGGIPYGTMVGPDGKTLVPNFYERAIILGVTLQARQGKSFTEISAEAAAAGKFARNGRPFSIRQISAMVAG